MTVPPTAIWPAASLLFGDDVVGGLHAALMDPVRWSEVEGRLGAVGGRLLEQVHNELAPVAAQFANIDLATVLMTGWAKHRELRAAGQRSLAERKAIPVAIATHDVIFRQRPSVDVMLGEERLLTVDCQFSALLSVEGLRAIVRDGALQELQSGACTMKVSFAVEGVELARQEVKGRSTVGLRLGAGIPLAPPIPTVR